MQIPRAQIRATAVLFTAILAASLPLAATASSAPRRPVVASQPAQTGGSPLRQVDWNAVLLADPHIEPLDGCFSVSPAAVSEPCINVPITPATAIGPAAGPAASGSVAGSAATLPGDVIYGDIDGDGLEEAAIRIESGGTAGAFGFLLYHQAPGAPRFIGVFPGYKVGVSIADGLLTVAMPFYFAGEGNCCPTAVMIDRYQLAGNSLIAAVQTEWDLTGEQERQATPAELTVNAFYRALGRGDYEIAYTLTSPDYQSRHPFAIWLSGYANTQSISVETLPGTTPDSVLVEITATDQAPGNVPVTRHFSGSWTLVPAANAPLGFLLDQASIR